MSPRRTMPGSTTRALIPRRLRCRFSLEFTNRWAAFPNRPLNLTQPSWGAADTSITAVPRESRVPGRQVRLGDVEVDVELVAGERPALPVACRHEVDGTRVRQRQLRVGVRRAVIRALAPARVPVVADETLRRDRALPPRPARARPRPDDARSTRPCPGRSGSARLRQDRRRAAPRRRARRLVPRKWSRPCSITRLTLPTKPGYRHNSHERLQPTGSPPGRSVISRGGHSGASISLLRSR